MIHATTPSLGRPIAWFDGTEYDFLSNFHPAPTAFDCVVYPTSEHAFQAAKTTDRGLREHIASLPSPGHAKHAGRNLNLRPDWEEVKDDVMFACVWDKFTRHEPLREKLLATGRRELVEGNTWGDTTWGVVDGIGENRLGKILMRVRAILR